MRSCRTASELTSVERHRRLSLRESISLVVHRMICAPCRAYKKQIQILNDQLSRVNDQDTAQKFSLDNEARQRLSEKINKARDGAQ